MYYDLCTLYSVHNTTIFDIYTGNKKCTGDRINRFMKGDKTLQHETAVCCQTLS